MVDDAQEIEAVIVEIQTAFHGVRCGKITLHEAMSIDLYGSDRWLREARDLDTERNWEDVPDEFVPKCESALPHLDPPSWRYYLPRYMIWTLQHFRTSDSFVVDSTIYSLVLHKEPSISEYQMKRFQVLSEIQSRAARKFLEVMAKNGAFCDAQMATSGLAKYWSQF